MQRTLLLPLLLIAVSLAFGCERTPEDLEVWRDAEGGYEKISDWAKSPEEPMPVRVRAVQILIEEAQPNEVGMILDEVEPATAEKMANEAKPTVESLWQKQDFPTQEEIEEGGGTMQVSGSVAVVGKDAAYFLQPYASGEAKEAYEAILTEWMSADQELRNQLGATTLGQIAPRAGDEGLDAMMGWLKETDRPALVAAKIRENADDDVKAAVAKVISDRAMEAHPEISNELEVAILETEDPAIVPYLEKALRDKESPPALADAAMDTYIKVQGVKGTPLFAELVRDRQGLMRSVAAQRIVELRGKAGLLAAANALPLDAEGYSDEEDDGLGKMVEIFCNFMSTEMKKQDVESIDDVLGRALESDRWPTVAIGLQCARTVGAKSLKPKVEALTSNRTSLPKWGEDQTIGGLAKEVAAEL